MRKGNLALTVAPDGRWASFWAPPASRSASCCYCVRASIEKCPFQAALQGRGFWCKDQDLSLLCINKFHMYSIQPCQNKWTNRVNFVFKQRASTEIIRLVHSFWQVPLMELTRQGNVWIRIDKFCQRWWILSDPGQIIVCQSHSLTDDLVGDWTKWPLLILFLKNAYQSFMNICWWWSFWLFSLSKLPSTCKCCQRAKVNNCIAVKAVDSF